MNEIFDYGNDFTVNQENLKQEIDPRLPKGYELKNLVGEGSIGSVYMASNIETKDCLAVKIVKSSINANLKNKIEHEYSIHKNLSHRNIVQVYSLKETCSFICIFMELVTEGDLFEIIPIGVGINILKGFKIYDQLLDAIDFCHERNIAHMDIKPENIMMAHNDVPKLIDFGLSVDHIRKSSIKGHVGTFAYSAPETFLDREYTGFKADLFSLHVTFLTMITGERCWREATLNDFHYHDWYTKKWSLSVPQRMPPDLLSFLIGALAHDPNDRFTTDQIRRHNWYKKGKNNKIKWIKSPNIESNGFITKSQPLISEILNMSLELFDVNYDLPLSQPINFEELLMPDCKTGVPIVKRMTRFFSNVDIKETSNRLLNIIEHYQCCAIIHKRSNHIMVQLTASEFDVVFRVFIYHFKESILVDFRRVKGDGLLFHNLFEEIISTFKELNLVDESHPYLRMVQPTYEQLMLQKSNKSSLCYNFLKFLSDDK